MEPTIFDHIFVAILFIVLPVLSVTDYRKFKSQINAGKLTARLFLYRSGIAWYCGLTLVVAALWLVCERSSQQLGFGYETGRGFWAGFAIVVVACVLLVIQAVVLRRDPGKLRAMAGQIEPVQDIFPRTKQEAREFSALSITAGICEEILYRGYLMAYITSVIAIGGMWPAALVSSLCFGLGHAYQGPKGVLKTGLVGLAMAGLYLLTGSIWLLIVLHAVMDLSFGSIGREAMLVGELHRLAPCEQDHTKKDS